MTTTATVTELQRHVSYQKRLSWLEQEGLPQLRSVYYEQRPELSTTSVMQQRQVSWAAVAHVATKLVSKCKPRTVKGEQLLAVVCDTVPQLAKSCGLTPRHLKRVTRWLVQVGWLELVQPASSGGRPFAHGRTRRRPRAATYQLPSLAAHQAKLIRGHCDPSLQGDPAINQGTLVSFDYKQSGDTSVPHHGFNDHGSSSRTSADSSGAATATSELEETAAEEETNQSAATWRAAMVQATLEQVAVANGAKQVGAYATKLRRSEPANLHRVNQRLDDLLTRWPELWRLPPSTATRVLLHCAWLEETPSPATWDVLAEHYRSQRKQLDRPPARPGPAA